LKEKKRVGVLLTVPIYAKSNPFLNDYLKKVLTINPAISASGVVAAT
jgi:hypothetical protein